MEEVTSGDYKKAYDQAIKYISLRAHTIFELRNKLLKKKFDKRDVEKVLDQLVERKYLNDFDFAQAFAQNLIKYKSIGYYMIKNKLKLRGINDQMAEQILDEELDIEKEKKIAEKAIGKSAKKGKLKIMMMLKRKGFRSQVISALAGDFEG